MKKYEYKYNMLRLQYATLLGNYQGTVGAMLVQTEDPTLRNKLQDKLNDLEKTYQQFVQDEEE